MKIRSASREDLNQLTDILNQSIEWGKATAIRMPMKPEERISWFDDHQGIYRIFVAEEKGNALAYLSIGPYRKGRHAFRNTAEVSYFVGFEHHRKGIASQLMEAGIQHCIDNEIKNLLAFLMEHNHGSIEFMKKFGFELWGLFPKTLNIDGIECDHLIYGKKLKDNH